MAQAQMALGASFSLQTLPVLVGMEGAGSPKKMVLVNLMIMVSNARNDAKYRELMGILRSAK
jgi:hypothetical protein